MDPTLVRIDTAALRHNAAVARRMAQNARLYAVAKADAYGHGMLPAARAFLAGGADALCVFRTEEAAALREAGFGCPVLVLAQPLSGEMAEAVRAGAESTVFSLAAARDLDREARRAGGRARIHVKVDTGMGRLGIRPEEAPAFLDALGKLAHVELAGVFTHFAVADVPEDDAYTQSQSRRFADMLDRLERPGLMAHASNSAGLMRGLCPRCTAHRPGIMLYGCPPRPDLPGAGELLPAMSFASRACMVKDVPAGTSLSYGRTHVTDRPARIATVPAGYQNGLFRLTSNKAAALVRGRRVPVVGTVCMNLCLLDVSEVPDAAPGDEVVFLGSQADARITADELAAAAGTISYEVLCSLGRANRREYTE